MPELPEVETIRLQLSRVLPGLKIVNVEVRVNRIFSGNEKLIVGKTVKALRRYSKALVIDLDGRLSLVVHLKMTGRLVCEKLKGKSQKAKVDWDIDYPTDKHTHVIITFTNGDKLYFNDVRKFGWIQIVPTEKVEELPYIKTLGPEFLNNPPAGRAGLTIQQFNNVLKNSAKPVKLVLMDQKKLAGVGNIYTNESLWMAKINPRTKANALRDGFIATLFHCLGKILKQAIKWHGASDNNYRDAFGNKGKVQEHFNVYNREGHPCPRCKTPVKKFTLGGRGTYWCPKCQAF